MMAVAQSLPTQQNAEKRPFSLAPDLDFLYLSNEHTRVYEEILSAIRRRDGLICLTGGPGAGKTVICKRLMEELSDEHNVVLVNTPPRTPKDMTETLDDAFGEMENDARTPVAVFDEAQHLDFRCLDHVKFLTNLERNGERLLQIVLVGQPELAEKIGHKRFTQLEQRIGAKLKLGTLDKKEALPYLNHRLANAGLSESLRFTRGAASFLYRETGGVPRLINRIANMAVEQALLDEKKKIGVRALKRAGSRVSAARGDWSPAPRSALPARLGLLLLLLALLLGVFFYLNPDWQERLSNAAWPSRESAGLWGFFVEPQFAVQVDNFPVREQAEEAQEKLTQAALGSMIVAKDLGGGSYLYQVRIPGPYTQVEAQDVIDRLRTMGWKSADPIRLDERG